MRMSGGSSDVVSADLRGRFEWRARTRCSALSNPPPASRKDKAMAQIGDFTRTETGYSGRIRTLSLDAELTLVPAEPSDAENAPDFRIHIGKEDGPELGDGWKRVGEKAGAYVPQSTEEQTSQTQTRMPIS